MRKYINTFFILFSSIFYAQNSFAQDIHYTQYEFLPLLQNAASAGFMDGNFRFSGIYRNQWASVPVNYNSIGFSADFNFLEFAKSGTKAGAGLNFYFDQAGDSKLQTLHAMIPIAYHFYIPIKDNKFKISLGFEAGIQYKSLSTAELYYDSQFNGEVFIANADPKENFTNLNVFNPDFGLGFNLEFESKKNIRIGLGFAVKHLNDAEESYISSNIKPILRKRFVIPFYAQIPLNNKLDIKISYLFNEQNKSTEHLTGVLFSYYLMNIGEFKRKLNFGVFYRILDAPSIAFQYETKSLKLGLSYDITSSDFAKATNTYGGVELMASYTITKLIKPNAKANKKCFTF